MLALSLADTAPGLGDRPTTVYAAAVLHALARDEVAGRRPQRLTEPGLAVWSRFRGRLRGIHLLQLVVEDAAVLQAIPFAYRQLPEADIDLDRLQEPQAEQWLQELRKLDLEASTADYIRAQAQLLGLPTRLARADLHQVKPHQKVLELPGTGGQLAHHLVTTQSDIFLQNNFLIACGSWQELTLAGLVASELHAPNTDFIQYDPQLHIAREERARTAWDFVIGIDPSKGGVYEEGRLRELFPTARILLV